MDFICIFAGNLKMEDWLCKTYNRNTDIIRLRMQSRLMTELKGVLHNRKSASVFRLLTVDAYLSAVPFYEKNGFKMLVGADSDKHTIAMYIDLIDVE